MVNLETFVWDMPTGVLRDVWLALSSLQHRGNPPNSRLEKVWVRFHDNSDNRISDQVQGSKPDTMTSIGWTFSANPAINPQSHILSYAQSRVEYPTLSALPALRSLSVLDIDELSYLDEMSVLIAKSHDRLRELRVGMSAITKDDFTLPWDGSGLQQVDHQAQWPGASTIGERRLGGVLGILLGRIFSIRKKPKSRSEKKELPTPTSEISSLARQTIAQAVLNSAVPDSNAIQSIGADGSSDPSPSHIPETSEDLREDWSWKDNTQISEKLPLPAVYGNNEKIESDFANHPGNGVQFHPQKQFSSNPENHDMDSLAASMHKVGLENHPLGCTHSHDKKQSQFFETPSPEHIKLDGKLRLHTLELERVSLSVIVMQKAFVWSVLTNLTILECAQHDRLWAMLRKTFAPTQVQSARHGSSVSTQYHLNLKKVHTDAASPALIYFLKETLAPNTLETLFLQDRKRTSNVTIVSARTDSCWTKTNRALGCYLSWTTKTTSSQSEATAD